MVVGVPLQVAAHRPVVVAVLGPAHGLAYLLYVAAAVDLTRRARLSPGRLAAMVGAGLVPFVAFVVERRITRALGRSGVPFASHVVGSDAV